MYINNSIRTPNEVIQTEAYPLSFGFIWVPIKCLKERTQQLHQSLFQLRKEKNFPSLLQEKDHQKRVLTLTAQDPATQAINLQ